MTKVKQITIDEPLFEDLIIQVGILKEIYDKTAVSKNMNLFQKKVLLRNRQKNLDLLKQLEDVCNET